MDKEDTSQDLYIKLSETMLNDYKNAKRKDKMQTLTYLDEQMCSIAMLAAKFIKLNTKLLAQYTGEDYLIKNQRAVQAKFLTMLAEQMESL